MFKHICPMIRYVRSPVWQRGSALIFALVFLLVMTVIGVAGMQGTTQQEKMAGNMRNRNLAFQAAEAALRTGEMYVDPVKDANGICNRPTATAFDNDGSDGLVSPRTTGSDDGAYWMAWIWKDNSMQLATNTLDKVKDQPRYVIEDISGEDPLCSVCASGPTPTCYCYRITALGVGGTMDAIVILQSTYQWNSQCNNCTPCP